MLTYKFISSLENVYPMAFELWKAYCNKESMHSYDDFDTKIIHDKFKKEFVKLGYKEYNNVPNFVNEKIVALFDHIERYILKYQFLKYKWSEDDKDNA